MANKLVIAPAPHVQSTRSTASIMRDVVIALLPALAVSTYVFGWNVLAVTALSVAACVAFEFLIQKFLVRGELTLCNWSAARSSSSRPSRAVRCRLRPALPIDVGAVVCNASTTYAVYRAVQKNMPLVERVVTVDAARA